MKTPSQSPLAKRKSQMRRVFLLLGAYYQQNHHGIARYARDARWALEVGYVRRGRVEPFAGQVDGIIGLITHPRDLEALRQLPQVPLVDLSAAWGTEVLPDQSGLQVPRVLCDNAGIARLAAQHFINRGFMHIALLNQGNFWQERARLPEFQAAVQEAGRVFHALDYYQWKDEATRANPASAELKTWRRLARELQKLPKPLAVFTASDENGLRVLQVCEGAGLRVPEEVAVLGCHNDALTCDFASVPLSSVDDNLERQGYEAASLLDRLMHREPAPEASLIIPAKGIVTRASSDILAVPHREVARALHFIWQHYTEAIQTDDVAAAAGLSRYHLMRLFQTHLGRSIADEITHKRIERAKELLIDSSLKAWQIAEQSGFSSIVHLSNAFTRIVGQAPSRFRNQYQSARSGSSLGSVPANMH